MKCCIGFMLFPFFLSACTTVQQGSFLSIFPVNENGNIKIKKIEVDSIRNPYLMEYTKDKLFLCDINQPTFITVFDWKTGKFLGDFATKGLGPNEVLFLTTLNALDSNLYFWDANKKEFVSVSSQNYQRNNTIKIENDTSSVINAFKVLPLEPQMYAATGLVKDKRIALLNNEGKVITTFGDYPKEDKNKVYSDIENGFAYQSIIAYQRKKHILAIGSRNGESIAFYDLTNLRSPLLVKEYVYSYPSYKDISAGNSQSVTFLPDNIIGMVDMKSIDKYCICLFSGKTRKKDETYEGGKYIFIFDWDGNPVKSIKLGQRYTNIAVNKSNKELILLGNDPESLDFNVYTMDLSDIF